MLFCQNVFKILYDVYTMKKVLEILIIFVRYFSLTCLLLFLVILAFNDPFLNQMRLIHIITISSASGFVGLLIFYLYELQDYYYDDIDKNDKKNQQDKIDKLGR
jgi:hypothetical protein